MTSDTSLAAAESIRPHIQEMSERIMVHMDRVGIEGATCQEIEDALRMRHQTASARLVELRRAGLIVDSGRRRLTTSGRKARVYLATEGL